MDNSAELNRLVREMNDGPESGSADSSATVRLDHWLTTLVSRAGSDLLLVENAPPCIRVQGELRKIESDTLDGADVEAAVLVLERDHYEHSKWGRTYVPILAVTGWSDMEGTVAAAAVAPASSPEPAATKPAPRGKPSRA
jgi:hypothetical protein